MCRLALVILALCGILLARPVQAEILMGTHLEAVDLLGQPLSSVAVGESFQLRAYVTDLRSPPVSHPGVFSAYVRAGFSADAFTALGNPDVDDFFDELVVLQQSHANFVLGGGASTSIHPPGNAPDGQLLFTVLLQAKQAGTHLVTPSHFANLDREWLLYLLDGVVSAEQVQFTPLSLRVVPEPSTAALGLVGLGGLLWAGRRHVRRGAWPVGAERAVGL